MSYLLVTLLWEVFVLLLHSEPKQVNIKYFQNQNMQKKKWIVLPDKIKIFAIL